MCQALLWAQGYGSEDKMPCPGELIFQKTHADEKGGLWRRRVRSTGEQHEPDERAGGGRGDAGEALPSEGGRAPRASLGAPRGVTQGAQGARQCALPAANGHGPEAGSWREIAAPTKLRFNTRMECHRAWHGQVLRILTTVCWPLCSPPTLETFLSLARIAYLFSCSIMNNFISECAHMRKFSNPHPSDILPSSLTDASHSALQRTAQAEQAAGRMCRFSLNLGLSACKGLSCGGEG